LDTLPQDDNGRTVRGAAEAKQVLSRIFRELFENLKTGTESDSHARTGNRQSEKEMPLPELDLYSGAAGIALFLSAYYAATKDSDARDLALQFVDKLRTSSAKLITSVETVHPSYVANQGIAGLASILYSCAWAASWLKLPEILDTGLEVTEVITAEHILAENKLDVMSGCAGTLLALLCFAQAASPMGKDSSQVHDLAVACGRNLLNRRISYKSAPRAWPGVDCPPTTGFAYGAAGIAYALVCLFRHTSREEFLEAALEGFAFERSLYLPQQQTWLDPRCNRPVNESSWRQGAPGIALAHLGCVPTIDSPGFARDLELALSITRSLPASQVDHLCCGNFGNIDVLYAAGEILGRLQLSDYAWELAGRVLARASTFGYSFLLQHAEPAKREAHPFDPSLFLGLAGVGYTLLRLLYPGLFPSVLLLESPRLET
jgi:lantibiotic modifying enzyme